MLSVFIGLMKGIALGNEFAGTASHQVLKAIPKKDYSDCFEDWKNLWEKCVLSDGDYFEGDEINLEE
ncbi:unnamed protein product [Euphydryas editha]|uniref:Uncharacterized protein n=1 Tax=Euphydryas editha TaxID=104508 RepID=A0AAU9UX08_EUPED|nr:unnamed protein product [Euphydryas editha]